MYPLLGNAGACCRNVCSFIFFWCCCLSWKYTPDSIAAVTCKTDTRVGS